MTSLTVSEILGTLLSKVLADQKDAMNGIPGARTFGVDDNPSSEAERQINELLREAEESKNNAYWERNQLVGVLSRLYPSHLARHDEADKTWEDDWRNIVCIHTPVGQATWHLHDNDMPMFVHLEKGKDHWDGHTTQEKYERLAHLKETEVRDEN